MHQVPSLTRRSLLGGTAATALLLSLSPAISAPTVSRRFAIVSKSRPVDILIDETTDSAVSLVAESFAADLERVSGNKPKLLRGGAAGSARSVVIIGVKGQSTLIDQLVAAGRSRPSMWCRIGCGQRAAFSGGLGCNL